MMGHQVMEFTSQTNKQQELLLQQYSQGIYFVSASTAHGKWVSKIILMN
jgi:hypothetical protein